MNNYNHDDELVKCTLPSCSTRHFKNSDIYRIHMLEKANNNKKATLTKETISSKTVQSDFDYNDDVEYSKSEDFSVKWSTEKEEIVRNAILGKKITGMKNSNILCLEDDIELELYESEQDCCAGANGVWKIFDNSNIEAGITDIEFSATNDDEDGIPVTEATITILYNGLTLATAECYADSGSGYYYSTLSLKVRVGDNTILDSDFIDS